MSLYDRDYMNKSMKSGLSRDNLKEESKLVSFVKQTYQLFAASLMAGAVGVYLTLPYISTISQYYFLLVIIEFALLFGMYFTKKIPVLNLGVMFSFVFMTGVTSVPLIGNVLGMAGGASIIGNAFAMTSVIVGLMSFIGVKTEKDLSSFGKPMIFALITIIIFSFINILFFHNPIVSVVISGIVVLIFSFMVVLDTQNIMKGLYSSPIEASIALYLDFLNIFLSLIQILGFLNNRD